MQQQGDTGSLGKWFLLVIGRALPIVGRMSVTTKPSCGVGHVSGSKQYQSVASGKTHEVDLLLFLMPSPVYSYACLTGRGCESFVSQKPKESTVNGANGLHYLLMFTVE